MRLARSAQCYTTNEELPLVTELIYRTAIKIQKPNHCSNNARYPVLAEKIQKYSWGEIIGSMALFIAGITTVTLFSIYLGVGLIPLGGFLCLLGILAGVNLLRRSPHLMGASAAGFFSESAAQTKIIADNTLEVTPLLTPSSIEQSVSAKAKTILQISFLVSSPRRRGSILKMQRKIII